MPGIAGFLTLAGRDLRSLQLEAMVSSLRHEPFHKQGTLVQQDLGLGVGWVVHEESFSDCLPAWNERKDIGLIFVGEHVAGVDDNPSQGTSAGNAAALVRFYEDWGNGFFDRLNGVFSGLVIDRREGKVVLFNDRYGLGRLYFHSEEDTVYFASEAKALLKVLPSLRRLDQRGLAEFMSSGCVLQNRTLFKGIQLLPSGSAWEFRGGRLVQKRRYFEPATWAQQEPLPFEEYYQRLAGVFTQILPGYLGGQQPVELSLTGGLDSRMIIAGAGAGEGRLPCHTFAGMYRECADVRLARQIADVCQQSHRLIPITKEFFRQFPGLAEKSVYYSDGAMDVMGSVELFMNRHVRETAGVRLTGSYGSEILRGNVAFKCVPLDAQLFDVGFSPQLKHAAETYAAEHEGPRIPFIAFKQVPWFHYARLSVEQSQLTMRSPFLDNGLVALACRAPADPVANRAVAHHYIADQKPSLAQIPTDRGVVGCNGVSGGRLAVFCQEFMPRVEYAFDYGMPQWLARLDPIMAPLHVERLFLGRQKFYHFRVWYRDELSAYVREMLLDPQTLGRPYLNRRRVQEIVEAHVRGRGNYTLEIHKLLTTEIIQRRLMLGSAEF